MKPSPRVAPKIVELADRIAEDIRSRGLRPGDPYLSAAETARWLRVSGTLANRALQLLTQRKLLERRQRKGTFLAHPPAAANSPLSRVHLVVQRDYLRLEGLLADGVVIGLQGVLPDADIQFAFLPSTQEAEYIEQLICTSLRQAQPEGFILVRSSLATQRLLAGSGLPTVVLGALHPSVSPLVALDRDQFQIGELLTTHFLEAECERLIVLLRDRVLPGDHALLDAVLQGWGTAGRSATDLTIRCVANDAVAAECAIRDALRKPLVKTGVLCRSEPHAAGALVAVGKPTTVRKQSLVALCDVYHRTTMPAVDLFIESVLSPNALGAALGNMLVAQVSGQPAHSELVPVTLVKRK